MPIYSWLLYSTGASFTASRIVGVASDPTGLMCDLSPLKVLLYKLGFSSAYCYGWIPNKSKLWLLCFLNSENRRTYRYWFNFYGYLCGKLTLPQSWAVGTRQYTVATGWPCFQATKLHWTIFVVATPSRHLDLNIFWFFLVPDALLRCREAIQL